MSRSRRHGKWQKAKYYNAELFPWWWAEPKWWRKMTKHKRRRAVQRHCVHQAMLGEENIHWPADKKPWIYYW